MNKVLAILDKDYGNGFIYLYMMAVVVVTVIAFNEGLDHALAADEAAYQARLSDYCARPVHNETLCGVR